jgi:hypothetical protein
MSSSILMLSHFHKSFPFNHKSTWLKPSYAGGKGPFQHYPPEDNANFINVNTKISINDFSHYYSSISENEFLRAMGVLASEYWLLKNTPEVDYIGSTSYRRYLFLNINPPKGVGKIQMDATQENANIFGTPEQEKIALEYLKYADVITNHSVSIPCSVEEQYLQSQPKYYWDLFKQAIHKLYPSYREHLTWFSDNKIIHFESPYIMRREWFLRYADEYFRILTYIFENSNVIYPSNDGTFTEPFPWRYPNFLGERFFPFFVHVNSLNKMQVPLVILI